MKDRYDVICIGSGPGGYSAAIQLAKLGKRVAVIDRSKDRIGGVCLNEGCIPVKSIIGISNLYSRLKKDGGKFGFNQKINQPDIKKIIDYSKKNSTTLRKGIEYLFKKHQVTFIEGEAHLGAKKQVEVKLKNNQKIKLEADNIILATGSSPNELPKIKFNKENIISSSQVIKIKRLPKSILIIGAGAIGIEFANIFSDLGSRVILSEIKKQILPEMDKEISLALSAIFRRRQISIFTECNVEILNQKRDRINLRLKTAKEEKEVEVEKILIAAGRQPNINKQALLAIGVELEGQFVKVDKFMRTRAAGIYAVGDITGLPMFAHAAYKEAEIAALAINSQTKEELNPLNIPKVVYSNPEIASLGLREDEARNKGLAIEVKKQYFRANPRAVLSGYPEGFIKVIINKANHKLIGVHIIGHEASELIHQFALVKSNDLTIDDIAKTVYAHPTFSEIVKEISLLSLQRSFHS